MSQVIAQNGRFNAVMFQSAKELGRASHHEESQNRKNFSGLETEISMKIDHIVSYLKELEENFSKAKKELFKESVLEGRENSKICAVQGKVIRNKDKYYNNLEQGVDMLSQTFQDSFDKISEEIKKLQNVSKGKITTQSCINHKNVFYIEENDVHTHNISPPQTDVKISCPKFSTVKIPTNKEIKPNSDSKKIPSHLPLGFKFNADHVQKMPKVISSQKIESLPVHAATSSEALNQNSSKSMVQRTMSCQEPLNPINLDCILQGNPMLVKKTEFSVDEENKSTSSGGFSDSNEEVFENEITSSKSKRISSYFDEPMFLSSDSPKDLKF